MADIDELRKFIRDFHDLLERNHGLSERDCLATLVVTAMNIAVHLCRIADYLETLEEA